MIDQAFVDDLKRWCEADGLEAGELDYLMPEIAPKPSSGRATVSINREVVEIDGQPPKAHA